MTATVPLAFVDTETTGVHPGRRAWEVAIIRREPDGAETTLHAFVGDVDLSAADPYGLRVGRFYDRHPHYAPRAGRDDLVWSEQRMAGQVEDLTRGAHLVGAVPNFDAEVDLRLRTGTRWPALVVRQPVRRHAPPTPAHAGVAPPPHLSRACGVEPAGEDERHTALGDALWAMRLYDAIAHSTLPPAAAAAAAARSVEAVA